MARLFVTPRELDFFSDITKELVKDVSDQRLVYYAISESRSPAPDVYGEAIKKVFDDPLEIEALVDVPEWETRNDAFTQDNVVKLSAYIQHRDLIDKSVKLKVGDFVSYGTVFYEIVSVNPIKPIYGQIEHPDGFVISCLSTRQSVIDQTVIHGPTSEEHSDDGAVKTKFVQQRGFAENELGETGDVRDLRRRGVLDEPLTGQRQVSTRGTTSGSGESFYDE